ncbi:MAG: hypothetical protein WC453_04070 [Patescibacteria group bacterium]
MSRYKIVRDKNKCRILFSDRKLDSYYDEIYGIFEIPIEGFYVAPKTIDELKTGKPVKVIDLHNNLRQKVEDCFHKVRAARYSLFLIESEIGGGPSPEEMTQYSEMIKSGMCPKAELINEVLINETESFIFQVRSNLDIIIQLLKHLYSYLKVGGVDREALIFGRKLGENTTDLMRSNGNHELAGFFDKEINEWIVKLNTLRNDISHRSGLKGFSCFVYESDSGNVVEPLMPDGEEVRKYCQTVYGKLLDLYKHIFKDYLIPEVKRISEEPYL